MNWRWRNRFIPLVVLGLVFAVGGKPLAAQDTAKDKDKKETSKKKSSKNKADDPDEIGNRDVAGRVNLYSLEKEIQLGKSLAAEWAKYNIRVNCISPGYMDTALNRVPALDAQKKIWKSLTPQERLGAVDDLNGLCVFLASDASGFMTGSNVIIDGGYTLY